jgi:D-alanyl-D-alanine carboxypeptidase (penicillin-binding protein 5/6)
MLEHAHGAPGRRWGRRLAVGFGVVVVVVTAAAVYQLLRTVPPLRVSSLLPAQLRLAGRPPRLPWPARGSAAVEILGVGRLGSLRGNEVTPLASLTKLMTALVILEKHPLRPGMPGPLIPISAADAAAYTAALGSGQSVVAVRAGERLSERAALEGLLVGSANNLAPILARWDAGSSAAFVAGMNRKAAALGLVHTHFVDPSGLAPGNTGTAEDMTRLGAEALANRTIAQIVRLAQVTLPVAGVVFNYDSAVGHHGIVGIKTGSSIAAGGNFVFAARRSVDGRTVTVVGAILKQHGKSQLASALTGGERLATAALAAIRPLPILRPGTAALRLHADWAQQPVLGRITTGLRILAIPGSKATIHTVLAPTLSHHKAHAIQRGERLGTATITTTQHTYTIPIVASASLPAPSLHYRLTRR